ncbi:MAG TPA: universal stress protein [Thermomicrobiales bacterium]|nr:universal stress protein [Thermomicrobiales bacterium]
MVSFRQAFRPQPADSAPTKAFRVIVPVSGGDSDVRLLQIVERIAQRQNANITIVYVVEVQQSMPLDAELPAEIERGEHVLKDAERLASSCVEGRKGSITTELLQARSAGAAIVDEAIDRNADAIMLSASLRRKHGRVTVGDTVDYVLTNAPCEVMVIRQAVPEWLSDHLEPQ